MLIGIALISTGTYTLVNGDYELLGGHSKGPSIGLIVVGSFIFITAFLGCCGAIKENYCMLITFAVILLIIFIAQLSIGITSAVYKNRFHEELKQELNKSIAEYETKDGWREAWDAVQTDFTCCGLYGPDDWKLGGQVPASCCPKNGVTGKTAHQTCDKTHSYKDGCYEKVEEFVRDGLVVITGVGIGLAFIELAGAILACFMAKSVKKCEEEVA